MAMTRARARRVAAAPLRSRRISSWHQRESVFRSRPRRVEQNVGRSGESGKKARQVCIGVADIRRVSTMNAEITTRKIGTKWHGYIDGRPDVDETALSEEAVRRKMEQLRDRIGACNATTNRDGLRRC